MLSLYLRPDKTQILQAEISKTLKVNLTDLFETDPVIDDILAPESDEITERLQEYFATLKHDTDIASEDVFIVLPDYLFAFIEPVDYTNDANLYSLIQEKTGLTADKLYITMPVETSKPSYERRSVYAIKKEIIDRITAVCTAERIALTSIEPASLSFFRAYGRFDEEMPIVELFEKQDEASIVTYSPAGGIFNTDAPMFAEPQLLKAGPMANQTVEGIYASNDFSASRFFKSINTDMPYIVLSENNNILDLPGIRLRQPQEKITFPDFVRSNLPEDQNVNWMAVLGTIFQVFDEKTSGGEDKYAENPALRDKPAFVRFASGNLLPEEAKKAARARQWKQVILSTCKRLCIGFGIAIVVEGGLIGYFSTYHIDRGLKADYTQASADLEDIKDETDIIKEAQKADFEIPKAFGEVAEARPDGCGFESVTIGNDATKDDQPQSILSFIQLTAIAGDELTFQTFRSNLAIDPDILTSPSLNSIQRDVSTNIKKASMSIGRITK